MTIKVGLFLSNSYMLEERCSSVGEQQCYHCKCNRVPDISNWRQGSLCIVFV